MPQTCTPPTLSDAKTWHPERGGHGQTLGSLCAMPVRPEANVSKQLGDLGFVALLAHYSSRRDAAGMKHALLGKGTRTAWSPRRGARRRGSVRESCDQ